MGAISELLKKYFTKDSRPAVRCTALQAILQVYKSNKQIHEEEILKTLIIPFVNKLDEEVDIAVKLEGITYLYYQGDMFDVNSVRPNGVLTSETVS